MIYFSRSKYYFALLVALFILPFGFCREPGTSVSSKKQKSLRMGYALAGMISKDGYTKNRQYFEKVFKDYDIISSTGFCMNAKGKIHRETISSLFVSDILASKAQFHPLINLCNSHAGYEILKNKENMKNAASSIIHLSNAPYIHGIHLDFEYLPANHSNKYVQFIKLLAKPIKNKRKTLSVAVFPKVDFPEKYHQFHNISKISPMVDFIILMTYDYHSTHSLPGPVTDTDWAEKNIIYIKEHTAPNKILLGIPAYGYWWPNNTPKATVLVSKNISFYKRKYETSRHSSGCLFLKNKNGSGYLSDRVTRSRLNNLLQKHELGGSAIWRLGFEED